MAKKSVWQDPKPGRVNVYVSAEVKEIIRKKWDSDRNFSFSEYVSELIKGAN